MLRKRANQAHFRRAIGPWRGRHGNGELQHLSRSMSELQLTTRQRAQVAAELAESLAVSRAATPAELRKQMEEELAGQGFL